MRVRKGVIGEDNCITYQKFLQKFVQKTIQPSSYHPSNKDYQNLGVEGWVGRGDDMCILTKHSRGLVPTLLAGSTMQEKEPIL